MMQPLSEREYLALKQFQRDAELADKWVRWKTAIIEHGELRHVFEREYIALLRFKRNEELAERYIRWRDANKPTLWDRLRKLWRHLKSGRSGT